MATQEEINEAMDTLGPKSVSIAGETVVARDAKEVIDTAAVISGAEAGEKAHRGLRFSTFIPPGSG